MDLGLCDRACIVTGASRGFGRATAKMLGSEGASVLLVGRTQARLTDAVAECEQAGGRAGSLALDVTAPDAGERVLQKCLECFGRVDALVNNAGTSEVKPLADLRDEDWQAQWELHVMGPMRLMRAVAPRMAELGWGRIVNVCSSSGKRPSKTNMAYSVTKAAQLSLSRAFADEYAARGVLVNAVAPGAAGTELWLASGGIADQAALAQGKTREQALADAAARIPLGRFGEAAEIAAVIVWLCSELASFITGAAWSVDGGAVPVII